MRYAVSHLSDEEQELGLEIRIEEGRLMHHTQFASTQPSPTKALNQEALQNEQILTPVVNILTRLNIRNGKDLGR